MRAIDWDAGTIRILDQTLLPKEERVLTLTSTAELADAIRRLSIRGAPALGIAGGDGGRAGRLPIAGGRRPGRLA